MSEQGVNRQKVLVADDSEMNRELLIEMLGDEYEIVEAENGKQAVEILSRGATEFSLMLLDINMPEMDGFEVLACMNEYRWIEDVPVIIISAETSPSYIERAYDYGATDFISRPFNVAVVRRRVTNTVMLFAKQRRLMGMVADQIYEREKSNRLMVAILAHIVEFRNGESGPHVVHINLLTTLLLQKLIDMGNPYNLTQEDVDRIAMASTLHDVGKLAIPDEILNKPGRFTDEEFAIMKTHTTEGAKMLDALPKEQREDPLVATAYEICRWHHERFGGRGYPDGIAGDDIPISAQVVSLADVYDALTSERCYKKAFTHEEAMKMIFEGQCGEFNPLLLDCLRELDDTLPQALAGDSLQSDKVQQNRRVVQQLHSFELSSSERAVQQAEYERQRADYFMSVEEVPLFTWTAMPPVLTLNRCGAESLHMGQITLDPLNNETFLKQVDGSSLDALHLALKETSSSQQEIEFPLTIHGEDGLRSYRCMGHALWSLEGNSQLLGLVGRVEAIS